MATRIWDGNVSSVFATAGNWSDDTAPVAGDTAIMPDGNIVAVTGFTPVYAQALAVFTVKAGYSGTLGSRTAGVISDVMVQSTTVNLAGSGVSYVNLTTVTTCTVTGAAAGTPTTGSYGLALSGATITTLNIDLASNQSVGVAALAGQTATATTTSIDGSGTVVIGSGTTAETINIFGTGTAYLRASAATVNVYGSPTVYIEDAAAVTTLNVFGGNVYNNSTGTIATTNISEPGNIIATDGPMARVMTTISINGEAGFDDSNKRVAWTTLNNRGKGTNIKLGSYYSMDASTGSRGTIA